MLQYGVSFTSSFHSFIQSVIIELKSTNLINILKAYSIPGVRDTTRFVKGIIPSQRISQFSWKTGIWWGGEPGDPEPSMGAR